MKLPNTSVFTGRIALGKGHYQIPALSLIAIFILSACSNDDTTKPAPNFVADYGTHIEPILYANCVSCHKDGGIAPFSLLRDENGYQNAVTHAAGLKFTTNIRTMPPYLANNDGSCKTFEHARWLNDSEIDLIGNWVDSLPRQTETLTTAEPPKNTEPTLDNPSKIASMTEAYTPTGQTGHPDDDYRCFVLDPGWTQGETDQLVTAFEVLPGNARLVHHVILFSIPNQATEDEAVRLDGLDTNPGYSCFGDSGIQASGAIQDPQMLAGWAPGNRMTTYPANTGIGLSAGRKLVMQVHYNMANAIDGDNDLTQVKLALTPVNTGTTQAYMLPHYVNGFTIPPGGATVTDTTTLGQTFGGLSASVYGVFPHMHTHGLSIKGTITQNNSENCMVDIPHWRFEWQQFFSYTANAGPVTVGPNDNINISCDYSNNTGANIVEGPGTGDEMCLIFYYATPIIPG